MGKNFSETEGGGRIVFRHDTNAQWIGQHEDGYAAVQYVTGGHEEPSCPSYSREGEGIRPDASTACPVC